MPLVVVAERGDVPIGDHPAMPPTKDKLARTERSPGEDAFALGAGIFDHHICNHRQPPRSLTVPHCLGATVATQPQPVCDRNPRVLASAGSAKPPTMGGARGPEPRLAPLQRGLAA